MIFWFLFCDKQPENGDDPAKQSKKTEQSAKSESRTAEPETKGEQPHKVLMRKLLM